MLITKNKKKEEEEEEEEKRENYFFVATTQEGTLQIQMGGFVCFSLDTKFLNNEIKRW